jgi:hypothetical protein
MNNLPHGIDLKLKPLARFTRKCENPLHKPVRSRVGEISYQCRRGDHGLKCMKLNCPCECHAEEWEK